MFTKIFVSSSYKVLHKLIGRRWETVSGLGIFGIKTNLTSQVFRDMCRNKDSLNEPRNIRPHNIPIMLIEMSMKPIRPWGLERVHGPQSGPIIFWSCLLVCFLIEHMGLV